MKNTLLLVSLITLSCSIYSADAAPTCVIKEKNIDGVTPEALAVIKSVSVVKKGEIFLFTTPDGTIQHQVVLGEQETFSTNKEKFGVGVRDKRNLVAIMVWKKEQEFRICFFGNNETGEKINVQDMIFPK